MTVLEKQLAERRESTKDRVSPETLDKMLTATKDLKNSGIEKTAFNVGDKIEDSVLLDASEKEVTLKEVLNGKPAIINFYRGTWCPYCNLELNAYNELIEKGINLIAISPERPESATNLEGLKFTVLSDIDNKLAKKLNLAFDITETIETVYKGFGIDLEKSQGNSDRTLPIPATYIVDASGTIVFADIDADYTRRAEPAVVVGEYKKLFSTNCCKL